MKYYVETIPDFLAKELKEKGMPMTLWQIGNNTDYVEVIETRQEIFDESQTYEVGVRYNLPTYGDCFDWFFDKGIEVEVYLSMTRLDAAKNPVQKIYAWNVYSRHREVNGEEDEMSWHEAANAAILKALELI